MVRRVAAAMTDGRPGEESPFERAAGELAAHALHYAPERLAQILGPRHFVEMRRTPGGPAPAVTEKAIAASRELLNTDTSWLEDRRSRLDAARREFEERSRAL